MIIYVFPICGLKRFICRGKNKSVRVKIWVTIVEPTEMCNVDILLWAVLDYFRIVYNMRHELYFIKYSFDYQQVYVTLVT